MNKIESFLNEYTLIKYFNDFPIAIESKLKTLAASSFASLAVSLSIRSFFPIALFVGVLFSPTAIKIVEYALEKLGIQRRLPAPPQPVALPPGVVVINNLAFPVQNVPDGPAPLIIQAGTIVTFLRRNGDHAFTIWLDQ